MASESSSRGRTFGRRGVLSVLGAGALTAASARFGSSAANASTNGCGGLCCNLIYCPPNKSWSACDRNGDYVWSCTVDSGGFWCECCEMSGGSAQTCMYN
jgi:hypothetical protein